MNYELFTPYILIFVLVVMDYGTGLIAAIYHHAFSSAKMREGLAHKFTYLIAIALGLIIQQLCNYYDLGYLYGDMLLTLICIWIIISEAGSILENIVKINPALAENNFMHIFDRNSEGRPTDVEITAEDAEIKEEN